MRTIGARDWPFWKVTVLVLLAANAWVYAPMLVGRIPFPTFFIYEFPAFEPLAPADVSSQVANVGDLVSSFYPYHTLAARALHGGGLPLWNPYLLSGAPFQANPQSALFYPLNAIYYVLPPSVAWGIGFLLRTILAALFTAMFVRKVGGSTTGAIAAGLIFTFSGFMTVWQGQAMSDAAIWLPLICYSLARLHGSRTAASVVICAIAFAMPVLAGHPETAAHLTVVGCALAGVLVFTRPSVDVPKRSTQFLGCFIAAGILAFAIAAVQIVPTVEWLGYVYRGFEDFWPPTPVWGIFGFVSRDILRSTNSFGLEIPEQAAYLGLLAFVAVPIAILSPSRKYVLFFGVSLFVSICIAYGIEPIHSLSRSIPFWHSLKNHRMVLVASFSAAVLAGLGISVVENLNRDEKQRRFRAVLLAATGFSVAFTLIYLVRFVTTMVVEPWRYPKASLLFLAVSAILVLLRIFGLLSPTLFRTAVLATLMVDVCTFAYGFIPFVRPLEIFPPNPLFQRLESENQMPFRVVQTGSAYTANTELVYGMSTAGGYEIPLTRIKTFLADIARNEADSVMFDPAQILASKDRRLDMLGTRYFIVSKWDPLYRKFQESPRFKFVFEFGETGIFENESSMPMAVLVAASGIEVVEDDNRQLEIVKDPNFDPSRRVVLPASFAVPFQGSSTDGGESRVSWVSQRTSESQLTVVAATSSVLVVSQTYYPGWKAWVDGKPVETLPANYALTAIPVGPGSHDVRLSFRPGSFRIGLAVSLTAVFVVAFVFAQGVKRYRSRG